MNKVTRFLIRVSAFLSKEIMVVLRQPGLILTLILGPFLILFVFGIGFRNQAQKLRTLFVAGPDNALRPYIEKYATSLGPQLVFLGIVEDRADAFRRLENGEVDDIVIVPTNAFETIQKGNQAVFEIYDNEIMPTQAGYVGFAMNLYVNELNRRVVSTIFQERQTKAEAIQKNVQAAQKQLDQVKQALQSNNVAKAETDLKQLNQLLDQIPGGSQNITSTLRTTPDILPSSETTWLSDTLSILVALRHDTQSLSNSNLQSMQDYTQTLTGMDNDLQLMNATLGTITQLSATTVVSPFKIDTQNITPVKLQMVDYYTPGVIALLLQHLCVTFAGLSVVEEDRLGALELFQVAPLSPYEMLAGKYISYLLFNSVIFAILTALVVYGLKIPMLGDWYYYGLVLLAVMYTSLGVGFLISLLSKTTSQAVQASMIMLLASVFFTGFLQGLNSLLPGVLVISWSLPATYGIQMLQQVMLRGQGPQVLLLLGLIGIGIILFGVNFWLLRSRMLRK